MSKDGGRAAVNGYGSSNKGVYLVGNMQSKIYARHKTINY